MRERAGHGGDRGNRERTTNDLCIRKGREREIEQGEKSVGEEVTRGKYARYPSWHPHVTLYFREIHTDGASSFFYPVLGLDTKFQHGSLQLRSLVCNCVTVRGPLGREE